MQTNVNSRLNDYPVPYSGLFQRNPGYPYRVRRELQERQNVRHPGRSSE